MNLSKEVTMRLLEHFIEKLQELEGINDKRCLEIEAEIKAFQYHLRSFEK